MKLEGYDFLTQEQVLVILLDQITQLESLHFQHCLYEPSKLEQQDIYLAWQQKRLAIETQKKQVLKKMNELNITKEELLTKVGKKPSTLETAKDTE